MGLETGTYINDLVRTNPLGADDRSTADDHLRLIKDFILNTFPNINAAVNPTPTELNLLVGLLAGASELNILNGATVSTTELNLLAGKVLLSGDNVIDNLPAGTLMTFQQTAAPTGWTKQATHNNKAFRVVSGVAGAAGATPFNTVFGAGKSAGSYTLLAADVPAHDHGSVSAHLHQLKGFLNSTGGGQNGSVNTNDGSTTKDVNTELAGGHTHTSFGGGGGHAHTLSLDLQYVDLIIASKD